MIKEIRKVQSKTKASHIRSLQYRKLLKVYVSDAGYVSYNPDEYKEYLKVMRKGRPPKIKPTGI